MFIDRKPTRPNRFKITPENGGEAYYVTLERADLPTIEGTPLNATTLNTLISKPKTAEYGQFLRVAGVDANNMITSVEAINPLAGTAFASGVINNTLTQIEDEVTITTGFKPKLVIIQEITSEGVGNTEHRFETTYTDGGSDADFEMLSDGFKITCNEYYQWGSQDHTTRFNWAAFGSNIVSFTVDGTPYTVPLYTDWKTFIEAGHPAGLYMEEGVPKGDGGEIYWFGSGGINPDGSLPMPTEHYVDALTEIVDGRAYFTK